MLLAKAGTPLTCENGHRIAMVKTDINSGDGVSVSQFTEWAIEAPREGDPIKPCPTCGAPYIRNKMVKVPERYRKPWKFWQFFTKSAEEIAYLASFGAYELQTPEGWT